MEFLQSWWAAIWGILAESGPWLLGGFLIAGLLNTLIPREKVFRHFGGNNFVSVFKAAILGAPLPLCSCSVIPTAAGLRDAGASKGATTSFLIATPETGVDSIGITWALMDPLMTLLRPLSAIVTAIFSGLMVNRFAASTPEEDALASDKKEGGQEDAPCCASKAPPKPSLKERLIGAVRYAFGKLMADLTPWFLLGFLISGLITVWVPDDFFGDTLPNGWLSMLAMLVVSMPMYICATASTSVAAAMIAKGLDPGAAVVLLLAGPATNITTILVVRQFLGKAVVKIYLFSLVICSLLIGWGVNFLYSALELDLKNTVPHVHEMEHGLVSTIGGLILSALLLYHAWALWLKPKPISDAVT
ncbi:MAG: SO_0444 family Cu/Zn efflux transporter [Planctomycetota bacterium]|nr:SO_0444 family Cu/Zn efflux transporter [Planctomycetota bacterium]MDA1113962.1 SO_0444 family Cu/Zn efflux transporter [Planctomycetota bacterium]